MSSKNCPNCAAPYDVELNKCPYCGACYFDMSCIDFTNGTPVYLKIKVPISSDGEYTKYGYITQKCIPRAAEMEMHTETESIRDAVGNHEIYRYVTGCTCSTNISFEAIQDMRYGRYDQNVLYTMEVE